MKKIYQASLKLDYNKIEKENINEKMLKLFIPEYVLRNDVINQSMLSDVWQRFIICIFKFAAWIFLRPRKGKVGNLDMEEVGKVYNREAQQYNIKHHLTTRGMDLIWRRFASLFVVNYAIEKKRKVSVLDLCTGTGLTIKEIMHLFDLIGMKADIVGLDYNNEMLRKAEEEIKSSDNVNINFVRGDVTNMTGEKKDKEFTFFSFQSFDLIIQVFGIGGVSEPVKSFYEILKILKEGGQYYLIDMHRPILELAGEWPFLGRWLKMPNFEAVCYKEFTIPLVLNRLWGWRDATLLFYLARLVTIKDDKERYFGFKSLFFEYNPQRWWFGLPIMPTGKIILEKIKISKEEAGVRNKILSVCIY